jgi:hypothetical protein
MHAGILQAYETLTDLENEISNLGDRSLEQTHLSYGFFIRSWEEFEVNYVNNLRHHVLCTKDSGPRTFLRAASGVTTSLGHGIVYFPCIDQLSLEVYMRFFTGAHTERHVYPYCWDLIPLLDTLLILCLISLSILCMEIAFRTRDSRSTRPRGRVPWRSTIIDKIEMRSWYKTHLNS